MHQIDLPTNGHSPSPSPMLPKLSFDEYQTHAEEPIVPYEMDRRQLIPMATSSALQVDICRFLVYQLQCHFATHPHRMVAVTGVGIRTEEDSCRIPSITVCSQALWLKIRQRSGAAILEAGEVPTLVIEVSSGDGRDAYIRKRAEYALVGIVEYWIIDPVKGRIRILTNPQNDDGYEHQDFTNGQTVQFVQFPELFLGVDQILAPSNIEDLIQMDQTRLQKLEEQIEQERQRADRMAAMLRDNWLRYYIKGKPVSIRREPGEHYPPL